MEICSIGALHPILISHARDANPTGVLDAWFVAFKKLQS